MIIHSFVLSMLWPRSLPSQSTPSIIMIRQIYATLTGKFVYNAVEMLLDYQIHSNSSESSFLGLWNLLGMGRSQYAALPVGGQSHRNLKLRPGLADRIDLVHRWRRGDMFLWRYCGQMGPEDHHDSDRSSPIGRQCSCADWHKLLLHLFGAVSIRICRSGSLYNGANFRGGNFPRKVCLIVGKFGSCLCQLFL